MREDFWPFVSACAVVVCSSLLVGMYAVKRTWFTDQKVNLETLYFVSNNFWPKVDYGTYEAAGMADMEMVRQPTQVRLPAVVVEQYPLLRTKTEIDQGAGGGRRGKPKADHF